MKIIKFDYVDRQGKETERTVIELVSESENKFCLDVSSVSEEVRTKVINSLLELQKEYREAQKEELVACGLVDIKFRSFNPRNMTTVKEQ